MEEFFRFRENFPLFLESMVFVFLLAGRKKEKWEK